MHVAIIGNGIAGVTAARFIRKLTPWKISLISDESDHFFSRTALMYAYMGHMRMEDLKPYEDFFWEKNHIDLVKGRVEHVDTEKSTLIFKNGNPFREGLRYDKLILATGSSTAYYNWPGQELEGVRGLYHLQDLEYMEEASQKGIKRAVIVGGGLIGIEMAEMFLSRDIPVTFLVRENHYWNHVLPHEESLMVSRHMRKHGVDLRLETELDEILSDEQGHCRAVRTKSGELIECQYVGITTGVKPNVEFLRETDIEIAKGILTDNALQTSIPDIYAAGDCVQLRNPGPGRRAIEPIWYTGRIMGEVVAYNVCGHPVHYNPGIWFNSAKFFDIEYQVYGTIDPIPPETIGSFYWEHPSGERSLRLNYRKGDRSIIGFNLMGKRYRQELCEKWIREGKPVEFVLEHLAAANFDPEFFHRFEKEILAEYARQTGIELQVRGKRGLVSFRKHMR